MGDAVVDFLADFAMQQFIRPMHFWLLWTAKASAVQSSKFVHLICYDLLGKTRIFLSVKFHLLRCVCVFVHLIYFTVRYSRPRATTKHTHTDTHRENGTMLLFLLRGRNSLCVQFMSFSNFAFCAKLTKIYSYDTTAKMQSFFFIHSLFLCLSLVHFVTSLYEMHVCDNHTCKVCIVYPSSKIFVQAASVVKILESCELNKKGEIEQERNTKWKEKDKETQNYLHSTANHSNYHYY